MLEYLKNIEEKCQYYKDCPLRKEFGNLAMQMNMCETYGKISANYIEQFPYEICPHKLYLMQTDDGK